MANTKQTSGLFSIHSSLWIGLAVAGLIACQSSKVDRSGETEKQVPPTDSSWSGSMQKLKENLGNLVPFIFDSKKFEDPKQREFLSSQIQGMVQQSQNLTHNPTLTHRDPTVRFVASQFADTLKRAQSSFQDGNLNYARYELIQVTGSCVQCHARMQQGPEFSSFFLKEPFLKNLPVVDQGEYLIATRQFDKASKVLLKGLRDRKTNSKSASSSAPGLSIERLTALALELAVQYEQDPKKAMKVIDSVLSHPAAAPAFKEKAKIWKVTVQQWQKNRTPLTMENARQILSVPSNEIMTLRALPVVLAYLSTEPSGKDLGEGLFLAGQAYESLTDFLPFELHEHYYESCIRSVPHTSIARVCYETLQQSISLGYTGTSGTHIPIEIQMWMDRMKALASPEVQPVKQ